MWMEGQRKKGLAGGAPFEVGVLPGGLMYVRGWCGFIESWFLFRQFRLGMNRLKDRSGAFFFSFFFFSLRALNIWGK